MSQLNSFYWGADGGGNSGSGGEGDPAATQQASNGAGADASKTYTQEELNRMFGDRASQAERSLLKKLGFETFETAQSAFTRLKTIDDGQKSELQKAQDRILELERLSTEQVQRQKEALTQYEVAKAAAQLGIVDPDAAFRLLDAGKLEYDSDGKPKNIEAVLKELILKKPYLAGSGGTSATNAQKGRQGDGSFTRSQLRDPKFFAANREAILRAMQDGKILDE